MKTPATTNDGPAQGRPTAQTRPEQPLRPAQASAPAVPRTSPRLSAGRQGYWSVPHLGHSQALLQISVDADAAEGKQHRPCLRARAGCSDAVVREDERNCILGNPTSLTPCGYGSGVKPLCHKGSRTRKGILGSG